MYARALHDAAVEKDTVDTVATQLAQLRDAVEGSDDLRGALENPELESRVKGEVLVSIAEGADELVVNFLRLIAEKGRAGELAGIVDELELLVAADEGVL
jgi:F0F1-type ATP synthase delta subunit